MSFDTRLSRIAPALTSKERGILLLQAYKADLVEDPLWRSTAQPEQYDEVDWYVTLINACNLHLASFITTVQLQTEHAWTVFHWKEAVTSLALHTWKLAELVPPATRPKAEKVVATSRLPVDLPWRCDDSRPSWLDLADALTPRLRDMVTARWAELRAAEIIAAGVCDAFDGEDPLRPTTREALEETRRSLLSLHGLVSVLTECRLEEPDDELMSLVRSYVDRGKGVLKSTPDGHAMDVPRES